MQLALNSSLLTCQTALNQPKHFLVDNALRCDSTNTFFPVREEPHFWTTCKFYGASWGQWLAEILFDYYLHWKIHDIRKYCPTNSPKTYTLRLLNWKKKQILTPKRWEPEKDLILCLKNATKLPEMWLCCSESLKYNLNALSRNIHHEEQQVVRCVKCPANLSWFSRFKSQHSRTKIQRTHF